MAITRFLAAIAWFGFFSIAAPAQDLTKVDRGIAKEPAYQSKTPRYCLLVFGPEAKKRVWLVLDGDRLYVDRNGNGDLTEEGEVGKLGVPGPRELTFSWGAGDTRGSFLHLAVDRDGRVDICWTSVKSQKVHPVNFQANEVLFQQRAYLQHLSPRLEEAPLVHFDGPLTLRLTPGAFEHFGIFRAELGTQGLGPDTFVSHFNDRRRPDALTAIADVEWPCKEPGGKPIRLKYSLKPDG